MPVGLPQNEETMKSYCTSTQPCKQHKWHSTGKGKAIISLHFKEN